MEYLKSKLMIVLLLIANITFGQDTRITSNLKDFEGIWQFIPPEWSNDTTFTSIDIIKNRTRFNLFYWHKSKSINVDFDLIAFVPKNKKIQRISDLVDSGFQMFSYSPSPNAPNDSIKYLKGSGQYFIAMYNGIAGEEEFNLPSDGKPNYFTFNFNGRENEYHQEIYHLPNQIVRALCANNVEKAKVEAFQNIKYAVIKAVKTLLFKEPSFPSKMYLLKNDPVEVVSEKNEWLKIKYYPEKAGKWIGKTIEGWIKKTDVE